MINVTDTLRTLSRAELRALHAQGSCPQLTDLQGTAQGAVLATPLLSRLNIWRGKVFTRGAAGETSGMNRLGIGPREFRRYCFTAEVATSAFSARQVVFLNHNHAGNPWWIRRFHDELVQTGPGTYLGASYQKAGGRLLFCGFFLLEFPPA